MKYGVPSTGLESAKDMIYPMGGAFTNDDRTIQDMYKKTHGNFQPGEQKNRDYEWKFNPAAHVFGYGEKRVENGAAMALHAERYEN